MCRSSYRNISFVPTTTEYVAWAEGICDQKLPDAKGPGSASPICCSLWKLASAAGDESSRSRRETTVITIRCPIRQCVLFWHAR